MPKLVLPTGEIIKYDTEDHALVISYSWSRYKRGAIVCAKASEPGTRKTIYLHRRIMGVTDTRIKVDHENRDTLNCRRKNLRVGTTANNAHNSKSRDGTSMYK